LLDALQRINPHIPQATLEEQVVHVLGKPEHPVLIPNNRQFQRYLLDGVPVAVIELKNPADENANVWDAYNQLQTYKDEISDLFVFNEALVISDGITARIGSLTANKEWFMPWRILESENGKPLFEYELEKVVKNWLPGVG